MENRNALSGGKERMLKRQVARHFLVEHHRSATSYKSNPSERLLSDWPDSLNNGDAVWLPLTRLLNSLFRFRLSKSFSPYWSTPDSYFTPSNNILQLFAINSHDIWIEREKGKCYETYESIFPLFLYRTYIKSCVCPGSAGVNVHNSQGHAPSKTSQLNFQPHVTPATPWTITQTRLWPPTNLSELSCTKKPLEIFSFFFWFLSIPALCLTAQRVCDAAQPACLTPGSGWHDFKPHFFLLRKPDGAQARSVSPLACSNWEVINSYSFTDCWKWLPP